MRPRTAENDLRVKRNQVVNFLKKGHKVKVTVLMRRFERQYMMETVNAILESFASLGRASKPSLDGGRMTMMLT